MRFEQFHYGWVSDITPAATVEPHIVTVKRDTAEAPQDRTKAEARLNRACLARVTKEVFRTSLPDRVAMQPGQRATAAFLQSAAAGPRAIGRFWCCLITREGSSATGSDDTSHDVASDLRPRSRLLALSDARAWTSLDTRHHGISITHRLFCQHLSKLPQCRAGRPRPEAMRFISRAARATLYRQPRSNLLCRRVRNSGLMWTAHTYN
jgi:hypothetical protein